MEKEFVPYELAVKLKELGFDAPCFAYYQKSAVIGNDTILPIQIMDKASNFNDAEYSKMGVPFWSAPTFSQAFRWFRDEHNLCGEVYTVNMGAIDYTFQIRDLYSEDIKHNNFEAYTGGYIGTFLTYEEAEQACLDELIEIVKNK